jgi:E2F-associated phosphoprotein
MSSHAWNSTRVTSGEEDSTGGSDYGDDDDDSSVSVAMSSDDDDLVASSVPRRSTESFRSISGQQVVARQAKASTEYIGDLETTNIDTAPTQNDPLDANHDSYYDPDQDEQDEIYVYQQLRGGGDTVPSRSKPRVAQQKETSSSSAMIPYKRQAQDASTEPELQRLPSDAVLQCPCCFTTVCMDCQQHSFYKEQFRAMFVMNIDVDWHFQYKYDPDFEMPSNGEKSLKSTSRDRGGLVPVQSFPDSNQVSNPWSIPPDYDDDDGGHEAQPRMADEANGSTSRPEQDDQPDNTVYFRTVCASCRTQVAVLDMATEIYYFWGCLASTA